MNQIHSEAELRRLRRLAADETVAVSAALEKLFNAFRAAGVEMSGEERSKLRELMVVLAKRCQSERQQED